MASKNIQENYCTLQQPSDLGTQIESFQSYSTTPFLCHHSNCRTGRSDQPVFISVGWCLPGITIRGEDTRLRIPAPISIFYSAETTAAWIVASSLSPTGSLCWVQGQVPDVATRVKPGVLDNPCSSAYESIVTRQPEMYPIYQPFVRIRVLGVLIRRKIFRI